MKLPVKPTSALTLEEFLQLPETKPAIEYYLDGQIYQKPMPQGQHSTLQIELASAVNQAGKAQKLVYAFTELRCSFAEQSIVPDIAVFEWQRIPLDKNGRIANRFELAPDWIVEILSPDGRHKLPNAIRETRPQQSANKVIRKITFCLKNDTKLGYLIDPDDESITVFQPNQLPEVKDKQDILPVLDVLNSWQLTVEDVFSWLNFV
ncbi:MAG: Uma2 family endonuclease [Pleurocapsa minor HA4230-MV1]|jgi:Uma2 family endonuclease|nr:Uma2 family endonuclease [Pleurocapsa minor HA4230-MV1]